jgi:hypothetical protein
MRFQRSFAAFVAAASVVSACTSQVVAVTYSVGDNSGGTSSVVPINSGPFGGDPLFSLTAGVDQDPASGNLFKDLTQTSRQPGGPNSGISSGVDIPIDETFTNDGTEAWTAWSEAVITRTDTGGGNDPGFLFAPDVVVSRNGATLTQGIDYAINGTTFPQNGNSGFESFTISFLTPLSYIQPTDTLHIQKSIHEVFGDANVWTFNETARIAEFPTALPEPATLGLVVAIPLATALRRRR